jgi:glutamate-1-semialdehyde aminotransferase
MIARAWTRRPAVLVADSAYHGWHDWMAASYNGLGRVSGSQMFRWGADDVWPNGVPCAYTQGIAVYKYGDLDDLLAAVARIGEKNVAAVLVEPARWRATTLGQMVDVRAGCSERGALMILDEMIYGGRWRKGGGAEYFGVTPDLACFGKAIANGAPIACVVGNDPLDAHGQQVSGTYSGDAASLAAVDDTLAVYESEPVIERLWAVGEHLARGLWKLADAFNDDAGEVRVECEGAFVHQRMRFTDPDLGRRFSAQMAARSVLWHPECVNVSYAHTKEHVDAVLRCAQEAFEEIKT